MAVGAAAMAVGAGAAVEVAEVAAGAAVGAAGATGAAGAVLVHPADLEDPVPLELQEVQEDLVPLVHPADLEDLVPLALLEVQEDMVLLELLDLTTSLRITRVVTPEIQGDVNPCLRGGPSTRRTL